MRFPFLLLLLCPCGTAVSQTINVLPYLQDAEPTSIRVMWETTGTDESTVQWGSTAALGNSATGMAITGSGNSRIHDTQITGLESATRYYYRAVTGSAQSAIYDFRTPPVKSSEAGFNFAAMSDMQQDWQHPTVFSDIVNGQLIPFVDARFGNDLPTDLAYVIIPGDLVQTGSVYDSWRTTFFNPAEQLFSRVPVYPVAGNHEGDSPNYFKYFHLPENGTSIGGYAEHWWFKDYSNVRLIGLESNSGYRVQTQLDWLQGVLDEACADADIDFVFAQLHHPHHSELWVDGNLDYTGDVITLLENFSTVCGKPSAHFFGHTHGYSRGQSKEHSHLMVNVATAGGAIDNWGEFTQQDYPEYSRSDDDFGFVLMEVQAGSDPQFLLTRVSHGSYEDGLVDNVVKDTVRIRLHNDPPAVPSGIFPAPNDVLSPDCIILLGSTFTDTDGDLHGASQFQMATDASFSNVVYDEWFQHENWYFDVDLEAGNNMEDQEVTALLENATYYWRVRYRDRALAWSPWSQANLFTTTTSSLTANLLTNGGAESGAGGWTEVAGSFEFINSGECAGNNANSGSKLFAVGGVCEDNAYGEGHQDVDVTGYVTEISSGDATARFGGYLSDYNGSDLPEFRLDFLDINGNIMSASTTHGSHSGTWTYFNESVSIPAATATIRMVLMGTREAGSDNDSYFDDMFLRLQFGSESCEQYVQVGIEDRPEASGVTVHPNPFTESTLVQVKNPVGGRNYQLRLFDRSGREVQQHSAPSGAFRISSDRLAPGFYIYQVTDGIWTSSGKLILQ
ncbi:MAG: metallophosphoesterase [Flavobacteriales bacterium]|nr:metallophosphoesterase [Flavobacteriales bacterium]